MQLTYCCHMGASCPLIVCTYFCFLIPFQCLYYHIFIIEFDQNLLCDVHACVSSKLRSRSLRWSWVALPSVVVGPAMCRSRPLRAQFCRWGMVGWWDGGRCHWWCYESDPTPDCYSRDYAPFLRCLSRVVPHLLVFLQVLTYEWII